MRVNYLMKNGDDFYVKTCEGFVPEGYVAKVPDSFTRQDFPFLKSRVIQDPELQIDVLEVYLDEIAKGEHLMELSIEEQKTTYKQSYYSDIDNEMTRIFGTTNRDKANSLYNTWKIWLDDPSFFSDKGLVDENGEALDTASKISIYANLKLEQTKDYSVFLMTREQQLKQELEQIS